MSLKSEVLNRICYINVTVLFKISDFIFSKFKFQLILCIYQCSSRTKINISINFNFLLVMSETKTYIVPDNCCMNGGNPLTTMAMMNNGGFGGTWNNPFMYFIWIYMMRWLNGGEFGMGQDVQRQLQTIQEQMQDNQNSNLIMQGINGNTDAIRSAAEKMGCDFNVLNQAICGVQSSIQQLGGQLGFSSERIINAVNSGDCNIIQALKDCCCNTQKAILEQGYQSQLANERQTYQLTNSINSLGNSVERGFCDTAYATQSQTCSLQNTIKDVGTSNTNQIIAKLDAMQNQALLDKIDALREKNSEQAVIINNAQQTAAFSSMIGQATSPIVAAVSALQSDVNGIKCKLPETVTLPYSCATAIPTQTYYNTLGWGLGCYNNNSLWG